MLVRSVNDYVITIKYVFDKLLNLTLNLKFQIDTNCKPGNMFDSSTIRIISIERDSELSNVKGSHEMFERLFKLTFNEIQSNIVGKSIGFIDVNVDSLNVDRNEYSQLVQEFLKLNPEVEIN